MKSKPIPPHVTGGAAFALVGAVACFVGWVSRPEPKHASEWPPLCVQVPGAVLCGDEYHCVAEGHEYTCYNVCEAADVCGKPSVNLRFYQGDDREAIEPVAAEGEDITV